ncbi:alpha/beta hydrolase [Streptomyces sp. MUM 203J]|uniref:alpha/beta hydrolase n=1 Tax=Streptomyces sp. MUM 203J TaxID=2791990 RepID=UPI001F0436BA|nr:alpha/beta hydrolase [Streptomyces sp. MUM 203J]MCH0539396.1 alpha/beta hydrolase [Streptomyces sp. MUM 203J]
MAQALVGPGPGDPRTPRLGRPVRGSTTTGTMDGVVLLLPDGTPESARGASLLAHAALLPLARRLVRAAAPGHGLTAQVVRYRGRGWNGADARLAADARWAVAETVRRHGDVPVCLVGHGMGARAALWAAGHEAVVSVLALAPWLPGDDVAAEPEPVRQLVGRQVMLVHGTTDAEAAPERSYRLAVRAKKANRSTCRFEVHSDGHALRQHHEEVLSLAADFVIGSLLGRPYARPVADAFAAPPPLGLRMPLAAGFGRSLRV